MKIAFLFPGQGAQWAGMGKDLAEANPELRQGYFDRADEILGFPISRLCFEGPDEELVKTENQQPAIFLVSVATDALLRQEGIEPAAVAGHSLGEYSALVAAGSLDFASGLRLTRRRGELMAEIATRTGGIMAAILGLPAEEVEQVCRDAATVGVVEVANLNSPTQTVISGEEPAVRRAMDLAKERGAAKAVPLNVSAPFHCSLMAPLASAFKPELERTAIRDAHLPVVANVTAETERGAGEIRANLISQLASPVRWTESVQWLIGDGFTRFVEVGPGRVLTGLMRSIDRSVSASSTSDLSGLEKVVTQLQAV